MDNKSLLSQIQDRLDDLDSRIKKIERVLGMVQKELTKQYEIPLTISKEDLELLTHPSFVIFADEFFNGKPFEFTTHRTGNGRIVFKEGKPYDKKALFSAFNISSKQLTNNIPQKTFTSWMMKFCKYRGIRCFQKRHLGYDTFVFIKLDNL